MKKIRLAILTIAAVLSVVNFAITPIYIGVIVALGWRSYFAFVPLVGLLAWLVVYFDGNTDASLEDLIKRKVKSERWQNFLLRIFKVKFVAIVFSALFFGPYLTPLVVNSCVKGARQVYFWAITLNMLGTALWIFIYLGGVEFLKSLWLINRMI